MVLLSVNYKCIEIIGLVLWGNTQDYKAHYKYKRLCNKQLVVLKYGLQFFEVLKMQQFFDVIVLLCQSKT